jgi:hypothetical protein
MHREKLYSHVVMVSRELFWAHVHICIWLLVMSQIWSYVFKPVSFLFGVLWHWKCNPGLCICWVKFSPTELLLHPCFFLTFFFLCGVRDQSQDMTVYPQPARIFVFCVKWILTYSHLFEFSITIVAFNFSIPQSKKYILYNDLV